MQPRTKLRGLLMRPMGVNLDRTVARSGAFEFRLVPRRRSDYLKYESCKSKHVLHNLAWLLLALDQGFYDA